MAQTEATPHRYADRVVNVGPGPPEDGRERRTDVCPGCGAQRWELVVVPDRFYCDDCGVATLGPNTEAPTAQPEQLGFDVAPADARPSAADRGVDRPTHRRVRGRVRADLRACTPVPPLHPTPTPERPCTLATWAER